MEILVIEPDKILADNIAASLKNFGFNVAVFNNPQAAVEHMDKHMPTAIVMELQLAPISGVAFLHELRGYEDFASVPVVVYSSIPKESFDIDSKGWESLGVVKYFYKSRISADKVASYLKGHVK